MSKVPTVDITIVTSMPHLIHGCLSSLHEHTPDHGVIIRTHVVWNGEGRGLGPLPPELPLQFPWVRWQVNPVSGFPVNQNLMMQRCDGDYVLLANDDLIFLPHSILSAVKFMEKNGDIGMLGPRLLNPDGSLQSSTYSFPGLLRAVLAVSGLRSVIPLADWLRPVARLLGIGSGKSRYWKHDATVDVDTFRGAYILVRRSALEEVGLMDERGGEETEWAARFPEHGWRVVFFHEAEVIHLGNQTVAHDPLRAIIYLKIMLSYYHSHQPTWRYKLLVLWCQLFYSAQTGYAKLSRNGELETVSLAAARLSRTWHTTRPMIPRILPVQR